MGLGKFQAGSYLGIDSLTQCYYDTFFSLSNSCAFQANFLKPPVSQGLLYSTDLLFKTRITRSSYALVLLRIQNRRETPRLDRHFPNQPNKIR